MLSQRTRETGTTLLCPLPAVGASTSRARRVTPAEDGLMSPGGGVMANQILFGSLVGRFVSRPAVRNEAGGRAYARTSPRRSRSTRAPAA